MGCTQSSGGCQAGGIEVEVEVEAVAILKEPVTEPVKQELVAQPSKPQKEHDESPSISNHNTCSSLHDSHPGVHDSQDFEGLDEARQSPKQQQDRQQQCGKEDDLQQTQLNREEFGKHLPPEIHNHFKFLGMIGTGSFSQVYAAQTIDDGDDVQSVAVKVIEIKSINTQGGAKGGPHPRENLRPPKLLEVHRAPWQKRQGSP
mmetsp:Transcript_47605/g.153030  ORF Transcript_47605/g.153030 Transcript_47605/m.153030 type:complete len:202 (+) Transcript_47605:77-682(+)